MRRVPHKTADAQRINEIFQKKKKKKKTLTLACMFFNLLYDVSILVFFFI